MVDRFRKIARGILSGRATVALGVIVVVLTAMLAPVSWGLLLLALAYVGGGEIHDLYRERLGELLYTRRWYRLALASMGAFALLLFGWLLLRNTENGYSIVFQLVWAVWTFDTFALIGGTIASNFWETHKIAPSISPKKSWEGALAAMLGGVLSLALTGWLLGLLGKPIALTVKEHGLALCLALALGHCGDFAKSWLKRWAGKKDSGTILKGHGGILDRFDSFAVVGGIALLMTFTGVF